jgi:lipid A 3-O-deacylase
MSEKWSLLPSLSGGYYSDGAGKDLGHDVEFYSQLRLEYRLATGAGIGLGVGHISNAGLGDKNPGAETVYLSYRVSL